MIYDKKTNQNNQLSTLLTFDDECNDLEKNSNEIEEEEEITEIEEPQKKKKRADHTINSDNFLDYEPNSNLINLEEELVININFR